MTPARALLLLQEFGFVFLNSDPETAASGSLWIDDDVIYGFCEPLNNRIILRSEIGEPLMMCEGEVYELALRYNNHASETWTRVALDESTGGLVLIGDIPTDNLDQETFLTILENFTLRSATWEEMISNWLPDDEGDAGDLFEPPPDRLDHLVPV